MKNKIYVMSKAPFIGISKTRLAQDIGIIDSKRFTLNNLEKIKKIFINKKEYSLNWYIIPKYTFRSYSFSFSHKFLLQKGPCLGKKIWYLVKKNNLPFIVIGSDIPQINIKAVSYAFKKLKTSDLVLGPTFDGGFWLIGFSKKKNIVYPFNKIRWSTEHTLKDLLINLERNKITYDFTTKLRDIDNKNDYCKNSNT